MRFRVLVYHLKNHTQFHDCILFYSVERQDSDEIWQKILSIFYSEWKKFGLIEHYTN